MFSCEQDVQENSPAFQGVRDSLLYRTATSQATFNEDGSLIIQGSSGPETLSILISSLNQTQVALGGSSANGNVAAFTDAFGNVFSTASSSATGQVNYLINANNTVSGTFNFMALRNGTLDTLTFSQGFMFGIPILSNAGLPVDPDAGILDDFTARVNTIIFNPTILTSSLSGGFLTIAAETADTAIQLSLPQDTPAGTYDLLEGTDFSASYRVATGDTFGAISGSLTIVSNDTENRIIVGDFIFSTLQGFNITDGEFTLNY